MDEKYEINGKDVDSALRYLRLTDPKNATRKKAIDLLEDLHSGLHQIAHNDPRLLEKLQKELKSDNH
jgi:hypothetical protein